VKGFDQKKNQIGEKWMVSCVPEQGAGMMTARKGQDDRTFACAVESLHDARIALAFLAMHKTD
jgi:hypothetical protein